MPRILFVKTSSLGDIVHNCPAVSDAARHVPGAIIDWVVEDGFAEVAALHASVRRVVPIALRRWRAAPLASRTWSEAAAFRAALRSENYDAIIDSQGLIKSALVSALARGRRHGMDRASARESLAAFFYDEAHPVPAGLHAVERNRRLAGAALGYVPGPACDFGLRVEGERSTRLETRPGTPLGTAYAMLFTMTSREDKLWPEERWRALVAWLQGNGLPCLLPWGTEEERRRCGRIASDNPGAVVLPRLPLAELARLTQDARVAVGLDTGLAHLAAALGTPVLGLYCASSPALTGLVGPRRTHNLGSAGKPPEVADALVALQAMLAQE